MQRPTSERIYVKPNTRKTNKKQASTLSGFFKTKKAAKIAQLQATKNNQTNKQNPLNQYKKRAVINAQQEVKRLALKAKKKAEKAAKRAAKRIAENEEENEEENTGSNTTLATPPGISATTNLSPPPAISATNSTNPPPVATSATNSTNPPPVATSATNSTNPPPTTSANNSTNPPPVATSATNSTNSPPPTSSATNSTNSPPPTTSATSFTNPSVTSTEQLRSNKDTRVQSNLPTFFGTKNYNPNRGSIYHTSTTLPGPSSSPITIGRQQAGPSSTPITIGRQQGGPSLIPPVTIRRRLRSPINNTRGVNNTRTCKRRYACRTGGKRYTKKNKKRSRRNK